MKCPKNTVVDHINHNTLDNRKCNLRICTHQESMMNSESRIGRSKYKGVWFSKDKNKWVAELRKNNKKIHIGYFKNEKEAAKAYNKLAIELFGQYVHLNKI